MSTRRNLEIARRMYALWNAGDIDAFLEHVDEELEYRTIGYFPGFASVYRGKEGFRRFFEEFTGPWRTLEVRVEHLIDVEPDGVLALLTFDATGRDDIRVTLRWANLGRLRDGRMYSLRAWVGWDEAIAEAGLDPAAVPHEGS